MPTNLLNVFLFDLKPPYIQYSFICMIVQMVMVSFRCLQLPKGCVTLAQTATAMSVVCPTILPGGSDFWRPIVTSDIVFQWERTDLVSFFCVVSSQFITPC